MTATFADFFRTALSPMVDQHDDELVDDPQVVVPGCFAALPGYAEGPHPFEGGTAEDLDTLTARGYVRCGLGADDPAHTGADDDGWYDEPEVDDDSYVEYRIVTDSEGGTYEVW